MNIFKKIALITTGILLNVATLALVAAPQVSAIPYTGGTTPPSPSPAFNIYTGVPTDGDESDFLRGKVASDTTSVNEVNSTCETGKRFMLRVYVHNGASQYENGNGNGPSVAKNTKVSVNLDNAVAKSAFTPSAVISASNAVTVTDTMSLRCSDGKVVTLSYVAGTAEQFNQGSGVQKLSDSIVTSAGAPIGTQSPNGDMWGCWDQRVLVRLIVEVKEKPVVIPSDAICKIEGNKPVILDTKKRTISIKIVPQLTNATVVSYVIDWGDGTTPSTKQSDTHSYANDGKYTIQATLTVKLNDGRTKIVNEGCVTSVEFKQGKPPVVPPVTPPATTTVTTLPNTGPANIFGIFASTSILGAVLHRLYTARRAAARN